eukprot:4324887-Ditylum_brightwellii.AAC.1
MLRKHKSRRWSVDAHGYLLRRTSTQTEVSSGSVRSLQSDGGATFSSEEGLEEDLMQFSEAEGVSGFPRKSLNLGSTPGSSIHSATTKASSSRHNQNIPLPRDALITVGRDAGLSVTRLLCYNPQQCLLALPAPFCMAFFRILIRILTNETDEQFDEECLFWYEHGYDGEENNEEEKNKVGVDYEMSDRSRENHTLETDDCTPAAEAGVGTGTEESAVPISSAAPSSRKKTLFFGENQTKRRALETHEMRTKWINDNMNFHFSSSQRQNISETNRLYSIVRFRCSEGWEAATAGEAGKERRPSFTQRGI